MFCPKCGAKNDGNSSFCCSCEGQLPSDKADCKKKSYSNSCTVVALRQLGDSPLLLAAIILFTANAILTFIASLSFDFSALADVSNSLNNGFGSSDSENIIADLSPIYSVLFIILVNIPVILTTVGLWITFVSLKDKSESYIKASGLTIIKGVNIAYMVIANIIMAMFDFYLFMFTSESFDGIIFLLLLLVLAIHVFINIYFVKLLKTINAMRLTIVNARPFAYVSELVAVCCFIIAAFSLYGLSTAKSVVSILQGITNAAPLVCFGLFLYKYKAEMTALYYHKSNRS